MAGKKRRLSAGDLADVVTRAEADLAAAVTERDAVKASFDEAYVELHAAGDEVAIRRHRKGLDDSAKRVAELAESLEQCRRSLSRAQQEEEHERIAARWQDVGVRCENIESDAAEIEASIDLLATQLRSFAQKWTGLNEALPERPYSNWGLMWADGVIARHIELHLFAKSGGMLCRHGGLSVYEISQGPTFRHRVRESIALALSARPKEFQQEPPGAA